MQTWVDSPSQCAHPCQPVSLYLSCTSIDGKGNSGEVTLLSAKVDHTSAAVWSEGGHRCDHLADHFAKIILQSAQALLTLRGAQGRRGEKKMRQREQKSKGSAQSKAARGKQNAGASQKQKGCVQTNVNILNGMLRCWITMRTTVSVHEWIPTNFVTVSF